MGIIFAGINIVFGFLDTIARLLFWVSAAFACYYLIVRDFEPAFGWVVSTALFMLGRWILGLIASGLLLIVVALISLRE